MSVTATSRSLLGFLASLQLTDSAFPSGRYTLSYGLEAFVQAGLVSQTTPLDVLQDMLVDQVRHGVATADAVALACAHRCVVRSDARPGGAPSDVAVAFEDVGMVDARLTAVKLPKEAREASARVGRQLLATAVTAFGSPVVAGYANEVRAGRWPGNAAVALGLVTATLDVPVQEAVAGELYAFASGWLAAAVRLSVIDHRVAQLLLHRVAPELEAATRTACQAELEDIRSSTPLVDVMAMRHERADLRLFSS